MLRSSLYHIDTYVQQSQTTVVHTFQPRNPQILASDSEHETRDPDFRSDSKGTVCELTSLRGRWRLGGQLGRGGGRRLGRRGRLLLGGRDEVGGVVVVDVDEEIELVLRAHGAPPLLASKLHSQITGNTDPTLQSAT